MDKKSPGGKGAPYGDREVYRRSVAAPDLVSFRVTIKETDMLLLAETDLSGEAYDLTLTHRLALESYLADHPRFKASFTPVEAAPAAPPVVSRMADAAARAGVGPMAAVAGAMAECVGEGLRRRSATVIVENGGDIYLCSAAERTAGIYAGRGPGERSWGLRLEGSPRPRGVCTSSGVIGPSYSAGAARAATVVAWSASLADAAATALGNRLKRAADIQRALSWLETVEGVLGGVAIVGGTMGAWGDIKLVQWEPRGECR